MRSGMDNADIADTARDKWDKPINEHNPHNHSTRSSSGRAKQIDNQLMWTFFPTQQNRMWYEALPAMAIITTALCVPQIAAWYFNDAVFGNHYRRVLYNDFQLRMFTRDTRIDGAPWKIRGLENIPDE